MISSATLSPFMMPELSELVVSQAKIEDAEEIVDVVNAAFEREHFRDIHIPRCTLDNIKRYFADEAHTWYVIKVPTNKGVTEIAAALLYSTDSAAETAEEGNIHMLAARPSYWGKKFSIPLLQTAEERSLKDNKTSISLLVMNGGPGLIEFYKKIGYRLTGRIYEIPPEELLPQFREKDLNGVAKIHAVGMKKELKS